MSDATERCSYCRGRGGEIIRPYNHWLVCTFCDGWGFVARAVPGAETGGIE